MIVIFLGNTFSPGVEYRKAEPFAQGVVWFQAGAAILVLVVALGLHVHVKPFRYAFQNNLETWLFGSDLLLIVLCLAYTVLPIKVFALEVSGAVAVGGGLGVGMLYTFRAGRRAGLTMIGTLPKALGGAAADAADLLDRSLSRLLGSSLSMRGSKPRGDQQALARQHRRLLQAVQICLAPPASYAAAAPPWAGTPPGTNFHICT